MLQSYIKLSVAALFPVAVSALFYLLEQRSAFARLSYRARQIIIGIVFGGLAVVGTEWGIPMEGAMVNCRDAAPLCAGLIFGAPAGIIAGVIGGVERWVAVAWGVGTFTRVACSVSTLLAGLYAAALRKQMFDDKKPGWVLAFAVGIVMEVFHLTMVFVTNFDEAARAAMVVKACSAPMITFNALSVMLSALLVGLLAREGITPRRSQVRISQTIQRYLLVCVVVAFCFTSVFMNVLQTSLADENTASILELTLNDVAADIQNASATNLIGVTQDIAEELDEKTLMSLAKEYDVSEINRINVDGIIINSTNPDFIGFNMASGEQSSAFLPLLNPNRRVKYIAQEYGPITFDPGISRKYAAVALETGGMVQVGYDAARFQKDIREQVADITKNRHVSETGYVLIASPKNIVVSSPDSLLQGSGLELDLVLAMEAAAPLTVFTAHLYGEDCYCMYRTAEGYQIISALPVSEALQMRDVALYANAFMQVLVFGVLFALIYFLIKRVVVNNIRSINSTLGMITKGNLDVMVDVRSNAEFASLSDDINSTVDTLKRYIAEAAERIDKELEFAKSIQTSALPNVFPAFPQRTEKDIFALMATAKEVGGDFYDFYLTGENTLNFLIADVSGKGIPAAMFMMRAKTELKTLAEAGLPLGEVFTQGNNALCEGNDANMFVTAWMAQLDLSTGCLHFVNAGHNPPLLAHADGTFEYLKTKAGLVLACMDDFPYTEQELTLQKGDTLFLYTDGVTEATDANTELYGEDRLQHVLNARKFADMKELCLSVKADVDAFVGEAPQFDDITMVAVQYKGSDR